jgi:hypothetical protein
MTTCPNLLTYMIGQMKNKQGYVKFKTYLITFYQSYMYKTYIYLYRNLE